MHRVSKTRSRSLMLLLLMLMAVALFGILAQQALALPTFDKADKSIGPCDKCHTMSATHDKHATVACATCHTTSTATPPLPTACASCHGADKILAAAPHTAQKCGTTPGCHGYVAPETPTIAIDTVAPKAVKIRKTVSLSGGVTPITTPDTTPIAWVVQLKKGSKWVQVKAGAAKLSFLGGAMRFSYTYKPTKAGNYRSSASFKPDTSKITSKWVLFKAVK